MYVATKFTFNTLLIEFSFQIKITWNIKRSAGESFLNMELAWAAKICQWQLSFQLDHSLDLTGQILSTFIGNKQQFVF